MMSIYPSNTAILNIKGSDDHCIISLISKNEAINLKQNADLTKKKWNIINSENLFLYKKNGKQILIIGNIKTEKNTFYHHKTPVFVGSIST